MSHKKQTAKQRKQKKHTHTHKLEILFPARPLPPLEQDELVKTADRWEEKQNADTLYSFCNFQLLFISVPLQAEIINSGDVLRLHVFLDDTAVMFFSFGSNLAGSAQQPILSAASHIWRLAVTKSLTSFVFHFSSL